VKVQQLAAIGEPALAVGRIIQQDIFEPAECTLAVDCDDDRSRSASSGMAGRIFPSSGY